MMPPLDVCRTTHGGDMAQYFPKGVRRYRLFPRNGPVSRFGRKRRLRMRLLTWKGYAPLATHLHAKIEEEDNPLWDASETTWRSCWDDEKGKERVWSETFTDEKEAEKWAKRLLVRFPTHDICWDDWNWVKPVLRDGD